MKNIEENSAKKLTAVVVTFNRRDKLQVTLQRLFESSHAHLNAVVVVDNASTDGTQTWLSENTEKRLHVIRNATNIGGAGGFDAGLRYACEHLDADWIVVLDDDARPFQDAFEKFHGFDYENVDAVAAAVYHPDGRICDMNRPWINPFRDGRSFWKTVRKGREAFHMVPFDYEAGTARAVDGASFVGFFLSRRAIERAGFPDPGLFIYGDDTMYSLTLSGNGGRILFDPRLKFDHDFTTFTAHLKRFQPLWKCYYHHRNLLMVYRKAAGVLFWPALLLVLPKWLAKVRHYPGERGLFLKLYGYAVWDGLLRRTSRSHRDVVALFSPKVET